MDELVTFLRARLDEDESVARSVALKPWTANERQWPIKRVLADVEAKRRIIATWSLAASKPPDYPGPSLADQLIRDSARQTLKLLALPYSDRPGYQEAWKP